MRSRVLKSLFGLILLLSILLNIYLIEQKLGEQNQTTPEVTVTPTQEPVLSATNQEGLVLVTRVIDGDTIVLENGETLRYIGIDSPEVSGGKECFADESTAKNRELVEGKRVRLEKDISERDRYGRLLRHVYIGETFVNDTLVREGFANAVTYPPDVKYSEQFRQAEVEAKENNRGLWSRCIDTLTQDIRSGGVAGDKDCKDFKTQVEAQEFFVSQGGPAADPHKLDSDNDGKVCESLP